MDSCWLVPVEASGPGVSQFCCQMRRQARRTKVTIANPEAWGEGRLMLITFCCSSFFQGEEQLCKMTLEMNTDSMTQETDGLGLGFCVCGAV